MDVKNKRTNDGLRKGVTVVEVLVVIFILGLLMSILVPAVQNARATSARLQCTNNLKQIGLAMHNAADVQGGFPTGINHLVELLPALDQNRLYLEIMKNTAKLPVDLNVMQCPSETQMEFGIGNVSYCLNQGTRLRSNGIDTYNNDLNGLVAKRFDPHLLVREITDGLSNTAAYSEKLFHQIRKTEEEMVQDPNRYFWFTSERFAFRGQEAKARENCLTERITPFPNFVLFQIGFFRGELDYDHILPPNVPSCWNGPEDFDTRPFHRLSAATSQHKGGVNLLLADGAVRFVSDSIDIATWTSLGSRADNDVPGDW